MLRSAATSYYHADGLGSVTSLTNAAEALAQTYTYDSFGTPTASSGSLTNPFRYTAREFDSESNLYFYREFLSDKMRPDARFESSLSRCFHTVWTDRDGQLFTAALVTTWG